MADPAGNGERGVILILEDDPGTTRLMQIRLGRSGYGVATAATPAEALGRIKAGQVELVVFDYNLRGEVNGLEFHDQVKALGLDIPAILITGYGDEAKLIEAIRAGVRDFVPKGERFLDDLPAAVDRVMAQVRDRRLAAETEAVRRRNDELRSLIAERERLEGELRASNQRLLEADRLKDEFIATLAHELRNPLAAISNCVKILGRDADESDQDWCKKVIGRQTAQLGRLIDDLLDVSRITNGKIVLKPEPVSMTEVATRAAESARFLIESREHTLELELPDDPLTLVADPARLEQILVNLLNNAAKYSEKRGRIALRAGVEGDQIVVEVSDDGLGISPEMLPRIFEMFTQVDSTHDRAEGGLGIGLTLVSRLVELHGGGIEARSEGLGKGSTFTLRLPLAELPAPTRCASEAAAPVAASNAQEKMRVLVVDDDPDTRRGMSRLLRGSGFEVETAGDGPSAVEIAASFRPRFVLLDIALPKMDGYEVARRVREQAGPTAEAPVLIAVSGYAGTAERDRARGAGFDHHLIKPVDFDVLIDLFRGETAAR